MAYYFGPKADCANSLQSLLLLATHLCSIFHKPRHRGPKPPLEADCRHPFDDASSLDSCLNHLINMLAISSFLGSSFQDHSSPIDLGKRQKARSSSLGRRGLGKYRHSPNSTSNAPTLRRPDLPRQQHETAFCHRA